MKLFVYWNLIAGIPRFSDVYLYNKLYWYIPSLIVFGILYMAFPSERRKTIIEYFDQKEEFYSFWSVLLFLAVLALPIYILAKY